MPICRIVESGATPEEYDRIRERLGIGDVPPPGASLHIAARADDGKIRLIEMWESREQAEQWSEKVMAAREGVGLAGRPPITYFDVHNLIRT
jgi:hypothetical protein